MRFRNPLNARWIWVAIVCTLLAATGCEQTAPSGKVEVTYWEKWTGFEDDAMTDVVDDFNRSQDRIIVRKLPVSSIEGKLMLATAGGDPPDLAGIRSGDICDFSEKGALTPLNKLVEQAGIKREDYIPVFWDLCCHRGFVWALPSTPT